MNTDIPDLIAGALGVSRGTAYDMMREALAERYAGHNPLGGPAKVFDAMAAALAQSRSDEEQPLQQSAERGKPKPIGRPHRAVMGDYGAKLVNQRIEAVVDAERKMQAKTAETRADTSFDGGGRQPAQQEPVAWMHTKIDDVFIKHRPADLRRHPDRWMALYKDPTPCQTCEALARTVMMDQTAHDIPPSREWVGLTDEEIDEWTPEIQAVIRVIEDKLKEKNT